MKILILNYTGYRSNWGSQATSRGLLQWMAETLSGHCVCSFDIISYPPTHWIDHWQQLKYGDFLQKMFLYRDFASKNLTMLERLCRERFQYNLDRILNADLILFQGEGAIGSARSFKRTQLFGLPLLAKLKYGKPIISINQTISYGCDQQKQMLKNIYNTFDLNFVREKESLKLCEEQGWPKFQLVPDAAFFYQSKIKLELKNNENSYFCVSGSADIKSYDIEAYARNMHELSQHLGLRPVFLYSRPGDKILVDTFKKYQPPEPAVLTYKTHPDIDSILQILSQAALVIGGRYHTSVSALSLSVPVLLTGSNSHKTIGLANMFSGDVPIVDHADEFQITKSAKAVLNDCDLRKRLEHRLSKLHNQSIIEAQVLLNFLN